MEPKEVLSDYVSQLPDASFINFDSTPGVCEGEHVLPLSQENRVLSQTFQLSESMRRAFDVDKSLEQGSASNESSKSAQSSNKFLRPLSVTSPNLNVESMMVDNSCLGSLDSTRNEGNSIRGPLKNVSVNFSLNSQESMQDSCLFDKKSRDRKLFRQSVKLPSLDSTNASNFSSDLSLDEVIPSQGANQRVPRRSVKLPSLNSSEELDACSINPGSNSLNGCGKETEKSSPEISPAELEVPNFKEKSIDTSWSLGPENYDKVVKNQFENAPRSSYHEEAPGRDEEKKESPGIPAEVVPFPESSVPMDQAVTRLSRKFPSKDLNCESNIHSITHDSPMDIDCSAFDVSNVQGPFENVIMRSQQEPSAHEDTLGLNVKGASVNFTFQSLSHNEVASSQETSVPMVRPGARRSVMLPSLDSSDETGAGPLTQESDRGTGENHEICGAHRLRPKIFRTSVEIPSLNATQRDSGRDAHHVESDEILTDSEPLTQEEIITSGKGASVTFTLDSQSVISSKEDSVTASQNTALASAKLPLIDSSFETPLTQEPVKEPELTLSSSTTAAKADSVVNIQPDPSTQEALRENLNGSSENFTLGSSSHAEVVSSQELTITAPSYAARASVRLPPLESSCEATEMPLTQESRSPTSFAQVASFLNNPSSQIEMMNLKQASVNVSLNSSTSRFGAISSQESDTGKQSMRRMQRISVKLPSLDSSEEHSVPSIRDAVQSDGLTVASLKEIPFSMIDLPSKMVSPPPRPPEHTGNNIEVSPSEEADIENDELQLVLSPESCGVCDEIGGDDSNGFDGKSKSSSISQDRMTENNELEIFEEFLSREITEDDFHGGLSCESTRSESSEEGSRELEAQSAENKNNNVVGEIESIENECSKSSDITSTCLTVPTESSQRASTCLTVPTESSQRAKSPQDPLFSSQLASPTKRSSEPFQNQLSAKPNKRPRKSFGSVVTSQGSKEQNFPRRRSLRKSEAESVKNSSNDSTEKTNENIASPVNSRPAKTKRSRGSLSPLQQSPRPPTPKAMRILKEKTQEQNEDITSSAPVSKTPELDSATVATGEHENAAETREPSSKTAVKKSSIIDKSKQSSNATRGSTMLELGRISSPQGAVDDMFESPLPKRRSSRVSSATESLKRASYPKSVTLRSNSVVSSRFSEGISLRPSTEFTGPSSTSLPSVASEFNKSSAQVESTEIAHSSSPEPTPMNDAQKAVDSPTTRPESSSPIDVTTPKSTNKKRVVPKSIVEQIDEPSSVETSSGSASPKVPRSETEPQKSSDSRPRKRKTLQTPTQSPGSSSSKNSDPQTAVQPSQKRKVNFNVKKSSTVIEKTQSNMLMTSDLSEVRLEEQSPVSNETSENTSLPKKFPRYVSTPFKKRSSIKTFAVPVKPVLRMRRQARVSFRPGDSVIASGSIEEPKTKQKGENEADFSFGSALDISEIPKLPSRAHSTPLNEGRRRVSKIQSTLQPKQKTSAQIQTTMSESSEPATKSKSSSLRASSSRASAQASLSRPLNESSAIDRPPDSFRSDVESSISAVPSLRRSNRTVGSRSSANVSSSVAVIETEKEDKTLADLYNRRRTKRADVTLPRPRTTRLKPKSTLTPETFKSLGLPTSTNKRFKPAKWVTNDLYSYLEKKLAPEYGLDTRVVSEKIVSAMYIAYVKVQKNHCTEDDIDELKSALAEYQVCRNRLEFGVFMHKFTPTAFFHNVVSCGGVKGSTVPSDGGLVYDPLIDS